MDCLDLYVCLHQHQNSLHLGRTESSFSLKTSPEAGRVSYDVNKSIISQCSLQEYVRDFGICLSLSSASDWISLIAFLNGVTGHYWLERDTKSDVWATNFPWASIDNR